MWLCGRMLAKHSWWLGSEGQRSKRSSPASVYMQLHNTVAETQVRNWNMNKEEYVQRPGCRKGKGECCNYIRISKNKQNNFLKRQNPLPTDHVETRHKSRFRMRRRKKCKGYYCLPFLKVASCDLNTIWTMSDMHSSSWAQCVSDLVSESFNLHILWTTHFLIFVILIWD